jgi:hypothetical protein
MPTLRLRYISSPGPLVKVAPDRLLRFLAPMRGYLEGQGFAWPKSHGDEMDYQKLAELLHFPKDPPPPEMVEPLVLVDEMSTDQHMDSLLAAAGARGIDLGLGEKPTPSDVAVQLWLAAPRLLAELHAEDRTIRQRNFCYFGGIFSQPRSFPEVSEKSLLALADVLDDTFAEHKRGRGSRVFVFDRGREAWILIRRGGTFRREESIAAGGEPGIELFRPIEYDVLLYDTEEDEIGLQLKTKWQEKLYLRCIGQHIFCDPNYFPAKRDITFEPLIRYGGQALNCADIPGLTAIKLIEVHKKWNNAQNEIDIKKADDVFATLGDRWRSFLGGGILTRIVLRVWFDGDQKPRTVTLRWPNITKYERDSDGALVQFWMMRRGFKPAREIERDAAE